MGLTVCSGVMAKEIVPITDKTEISEKTTVTVTNSDKKGTAVDVAKEENVSITTSDGDYDIILNSEGKGIRANNTSVVLNSSGDNKIHFNTKIIEGEMVASGGQGNGIIAQNGGTVTLTAENGSNLLQGSNGDGIYLESDGAVDLKAKENKIDAGQEGIRDQYNDFLADENTVILVEALAGNNAITAGANGIRHEWSNNVLLKAENGYNSVQANSAGIMLEGQSSGTVSLTGKGNIVSGTENAGIYITGGSKGTVNITANASGSDGISNHVSGKNGIHAESGKVVMEAAVGTNVIKGETNGIYDKVGEVSLNGYRNEISGGKGILMESSGKVSVAATEKNIVTGDKGYGIKAQAGTVELISKTTNSVSGGKVSEFASETRNIVHLGDGYAVYAAGEKEADRTQMIFSAADRNEFFGTVYASGNASVQVGFDQYIGGGNMENYIASSAVIGTAEASGDKDTDIVSALYAGEGASITVKGEQNTILSSVNSNVKSNSDAAERTIWASKGGSIEIDGQTDVAASLAGKENTVSIAMAAGTGDWDDSKLVDGKLPVLGENAARSTIQLNYASESRIAGDVVSGYGGKIIIAPHSSGESPETAERSASDRLVFKGNALASNGGELTIDLGNNGYWEGRADSYKDADSDLKEEHTSFFAPEFSKGVLSSGTVNINMGDNSYWNVTGQSWVSSLSGSGIIDMRNHAVTEGTDSSES
mgnify:CR=1 FL=1